MKKLSLILFTLLSQMVVGSLWTTNYNYIYDPQFNYPLQIRIITVLMLVCLVISLFHLGAPINAPKAIKNLTNSWLSREILSALILTIILVTLTVNSYFNTPPQLTSFLLAIASLVGFIFIFSMSKIYTIRTIPAWNTVYTPLSFFNTAFLLSILFTNSLSTQNNIISLNTTIIFLLLLVIDLWGYLTWINKNFNRLKYPESPLPIEFRVNHTLKIFLTLISTILIFGCVMNPKNHQFFLFSCLASTGISLFISRRLFYSSIEINKGYHHNLSPEIK